MVHKTSIVPALSQFIDEVILSHYPPTSMKRILAAGGISLYLKQNVNMIDNLTSNPLFAGLGVSTSDGMIDIDAIKDVIKPEINKAGFMRISLPIIGDVDFTAEDVDTLYKHIITANSALVTSPTQNVTQSGGILY